MLWIGVKPGVKFKLRMKVRIIYVAALTLIRASRWTGPDHVLMPIIGMQALSGCSTPSTASASPSCPLKRLYGSRSR